jgi:GT2 family glycosyltransferase
MITIVYSTHKDSEYNNKFKQHLLQTVGLKDVQILEYQNNNQYSLAEVYNSGITESIYDIVVCCHNDIKLEKGWGKKLIKDFEENPDFGIIGKAGSCYFPESGVYWEKMNQTMVGQVYHEPKGMKKWLSPYSGKLPFLVPVVTIDGLFISFNKMKIKHQFDESIGKFHFYDHSFCVPNYLDGVKIGVTNSFEITHESVGQPNAEFYQSKDKFLGKYGSKLPIDLKPEKVFAPTIKENLSKKNGKVAVIIPTKGKVEMLLSCIQSYYEHCNSELFDIFIADTGSTDEEKKFISEEILSLGNIHLLEYDFYNFSRINNDVVKNHLNDEYEFLLFSNNDVKLLNNVIGGMLSVYKEKPFAGTVGCRLHFGDGTIQHCGVATMIDKDNNFRLSHNGFSSYYGYSLNLIDVVGNTAALMMIRKKVFEKIGGFNEKYSECFEDVELNFECLRIGLTNYMDARLVSFHYESQTRNQDILKNKRTNNDYSNLLFPYFKKNINYIKKYLIPI